MKYQFIVNPHARSGHGHKVWDVVEKELIRKKIDYHVYFSHREGHITSLAGMITKNLDQTGEDVTVVVVGGDGSMNEALQGITNFRHVILGYIPAGSGNDFTRYHRIPNDPSAALNCILSAEKMADLDIGFAVMDSGRRRFGVSSGIGFDAGVCHEVARSRLKVFLNRLRLGKLTYLGVALKQLFMVKPVEANVILDGKEEHFTKTYFAAVMNQPYEGGGFFFCPEGKPDDRLLDLIVVHDISVWKILRVLPTAFKGKHVRYQGVTIRKFKQAEIHFSESRPIHSDGEPVFVGKMLKAGLEDEPIRLIIPG